MYTIVICCTRMLFPCSCIEFADVYLKLVCPSWFRERMYVSLSSQKQCQSVSHLLSSIYMLLYTYIRIKETEKACAPVLGQCCLLLE